MSTLFYNGITLELVKTLRCDRQFVYDGPQYLWTRWQIAVQGVYNPRATSYAGHGGKTGVPVPTPGCAPPCTDDAIRHALAQPQKKLVYSMAPTPAVNFPTPPGSPVVLETPPPLDPNTPNFSTNTNLDRYFTDANNGPRPFHLNVREILGLKSWWVEFGVEACVNECYRPDGKPPVLLSHLWRMRSEMDRDGFTTRHVAGHYVFRTDALLDNLATPDDFREVLAHPVPPNFERRGVVCEQNEEGNRVDYQFADREVSHNLTVRNVTRIEAFVTAGQTTGALWTEKAPIIALETLRGGRPRMGFGAGLAAIGEAMLSLMPHTSFLLSVRVWGNRNSTRENLFRAAAHVVGAKFPPARTNVQGVGPYCENLNVTLDLMGRFVEITAVYTGGPLASSGMAGQDFVQAHPYFFDMEVGQAATPGDRPGRAPVAGSLTAGTYLGALVAQLLKQPCKNPSYPPDHTPSSDDPLPST